MIVIKCNCYCLRNRRAEIDSLAKDTNCSLLHCVWVILESTRGWQAVTGKSKYKAIIVTACYVVRVHVCHLYIL